MNAERGEFERGPDGTDVVADISMVRLILIELQSGVPAGGGHPDGGLSPVRVLFPNEYSPRRYLEPPLCRGRLLLRHGTQRLPA